MYDMNKTNESVRTGKDLNKQNVKINTFSLSPSLFHCSFVGFISYPNNFIDLSLFICSHTVLILLWLNVRKGNRPTQTIETPQFNIPTCVVYICWHYLRLLTKRTELLCKRNFLLVSSHHFFCYFFFSFIIHSQYKIVKLNEQTSACSFSSIFLETKWATRDQHTLVLKMCNENKKTGTWLCSIKYRITKTFTFLFT